MTAPDSGLKNRSDHLQAHFLHTSTPDLPDATPQVATQQQQAGRRRSSRSRVFDPAGEGGLGPGKLANNLDTSLLL